MAMYQNAYLEKSIVFADMVRMPSWTMEDGPAKASNRRDSGC